MKLTNAPIIIESEPKLIQAGYIPLLKEINNVLAIYIRDPNLNDFNDTSIPTMEIGRIIAKRKIPQNIYSCRNYSLAAMAAALALEDKGYPLQLWLFMLHSDFNRCKDRLTSSESPEAKKGRMLKREIDKIVYMAVANNKSISSRAKLLLITKALSFYNPLVENPEDYEQDPRVPDILVAPPGDDVQGLVQLLMCASDNLKVIEDIATKIMSFYEPLLKDLLGIIKSEGTT